MAADIRADVKVEPQDDARQLLGPAVSGHASKCPSRLTTVLSANHLHVSDGRKRIAREHHTIRFVDSLPAIVESVPMTPTPVRILSDQLS